MKPRLSFARARGTPIQAHGRTLVPEARVFTWAARQATFGTRQTAFSGVWVQYARPTALIELTPDGERRYPIVDVTGRTLATMAAAATLIPVLARVAAGWTRRT